MNLFEDDLQEHFHVHHGPTLKNLQELMDLTSLMTDEQFRHHVRDGKHDFADWIAHVGGSEDAVSTIRSTKTRDELVEALKNVRDGVHTGIEDEQFDKLHEEYTSVNERMHDKFDKIATDMQTAIDDEMPDNLVKIEDELKDRREELRQKISELRKAGKDMLMAALALKQFLPKLAYAHATREPRDYDEAKDVLRETEAEIAEAEQQKEINFKKEVLALAGEGLKTDDDEGKKR